MGKFEDLKGIGYATPNIYPMIFFALSSFLDSLEAFSPQLVDSNMPLHPSTRDRTSPSSPKHSPVFCCCFDSGTREITLEIQKGAFPLQKRTENVVLRPKMQTKT